ncbi:MAG: transcriptional regulator [Actinobacteria bacterium]|uniref:helix-turn-helix domain-containing protein n=1 Tax=unclassified Microbacterium TaxID=2609290 RepID=UPI0010023E4A|nr:helix-turn-helix domain-containing protein [Microbacterium sp. UBA837]RUA26555.1 MAG: transcriptional regulator [Actinomycetota bacterium]|tara:strand:+ start:332 stop:574 length:243 start_codon:yes stop_codon:yes gene_type:complete
MRVLIDDPSDLGRVIRRIREQHGWTQRRLAAALGVGQRYVHELETGRAKRFDTHYLQVLAALGVRLVAEVDDSDPAASES